MKHLVKKLLLACPGFEALCRLLTARTVRSLMYHRFAAGATGNLRCVEAEALRLQAAYLVRHHTLWQPDDILARRAGGRGARCPVVVTVDDGYRDFHDVAYPIFRAHGIPAMLFVTTGFVDGRVWFWWDRLEYLLGLAPQARELEVQIGGQTLRLELSTAAGREAAWHAVADRCRFVPEEQKQAALGALAAGLGVEPPPGPPPAYAPVTWDQVRDMAAGGMLFGAHTVTHPILSRVGPDQARHEITASRGRLAEVLGEPPAWFCYPQGGPADYTPQVRDLVAGAGFRGCFVAYQNLLEPEDVYALPRSCVTADMTEFRWTLCGAEIMVLRLRRRLGLSTEPGASYWAGSS